MVGYQQGFAEDGLAGAPGDWREQICFAIRDQSLDGFQVAAKIADGVVPGSGVGGRGRGWPIFVVPFAVFVCWVGAEVEDVLLGDAEMFEEHPGGVGEVRGLCAAEIGWEIFCDVVEGGVGLASG